MLNYSICEETQLLVCEIRDHILVREDGSVSNTRSIGNTKKGWHCGSKQNKGYRTIYGGGKNCKIHRLVAEAFLPVVSGKDFIDHINGKKDDNRLENLRWVSRRENCANTETHRAGRLPGTTFISRGNRKKAWVAQITDNLQHRCIGYYYTEQEAHEAYLRYIKDNQL